MFEIGHALAILHRMTARTAFPFAGRSRPNPSGELESQQVLLTWQTLTIAQRNGRVTKLRSCIPLYEKMFSGCVTITAALWPEPVPALQPKAIYGMKTAA